MIERPNGLFFELKDLPAEVQERAIRSFLKGNMKAIRAAMRQRRCDMREFGLMWMIYCRDQATF